MTIDQPLLKQKVSEYKRQYPAYKAYAEFLKIVLGQACQRLFPYAIVEARPKAIASFAEKIVRKQEKFHRDPAYDLTDRCGARVITQTAQEKEHICDYIRKNFIIDQANTVDVKTRLKEDQFGYLSVHYVVQLPANATHKLGTPVPKGVLTGENGFKAEIQVRTLLEHAWANPLHDRLYKVAIQTPPAIRREAAGLAAHLEVADDCLGRVAAEIDSFLGHYAAYIEPDALENEILIQSAGLQFEKDVIKAAPLQLRLGRLLTMRGDDDLARAAWKQGLTVSTASREALLMELGSLLCRQSRQKTSSTDYKTGLKMLVEVAQRETREKDTHSHASKTTRAEASHRLAWAYGNQRGKEKEARDWYRRALDLDPGNPYHLADYLGYEVYCTRNAEFIGAMRDYVMRGIAVCQRHVQVGIEQPRAQFTMARLHLMIKQETMALDAYLKAIRFLLTPRSYSRAEMLDDEIAFLNSINFGKPLPPEHDLVRRLLELARAVKQLQAGKPYDLSAAMSPAAKKGNLGRPTRVTIFAGGAGQMPDAKVRDYRQIIQWAMSHADGLVCSGGTVTGIPGLVGDAADVLRQENRKQFQLIGYIPSTFPHDALPDHERYDTLVVTEADRFNSLQPIQNWVDLLGLGVTPQQVRLLGIEGGDIAGVEYRLALALGAKVGIIPDSGRAADQLLLDPDWSCNSNLIRLPVTVLDEATLRAFVRPGAVNIERERIDELAQRVHETYLKNTPYSEVDPVRRKFSRLRADLQESNRQQVLYAEEILTSEGYSLHFVGDGVEIVQPPFDDAEEIDRMAALEHGRWNIERLSEGWRYGSPKDAAQKINPWLVPWSKLTDGENGMKRYDRQAILDYAANLKAAGYQIVKHGNLA